MGMTVASVPACTAAAVVAAAIIERFISWHLDGFVGLGVAGFILWSGANAVKETISPLLGEAAGPELREEILDQIKKLQKEAGITVILVSHSMEDVAKYADRVLVMNKGKVAMFDTTEKVKKAFDENGIEIPYPQLDVHVKND